jgi:hypothetical protein
MVFSIYSQASGGTALWTETQTVTVTDGVFSANLGDTNPITLPFDTLYYLGITIGSDSEMTPRQPMTSVGYAFRAKEADSVKDNAVTTAVIANDAVTTDKVADDAISGDKIAQGAVTSTNIANGAVGAPQIGDGTIATEDLADDAVTAAKIQPSIISSIDGVTNDGGNVDLVAGTNVTITPDDVANTITIASADGGGGSSLWTESGGNVYRNSGNVGIGTTNPQQKLHVNGLARFDLPTGQINISTPGGCPGVIGLAPNGNRRDIIFDNVGLRLLTSSTSSAPPGLNGVTIRENGYVCIGSSTPSATLHVTGDDGVLFEGTYHSGTIPKEGSGTRMMWYPRKAAFRAGEVNGTQWDDAAIGDNSIAMGHNTEASGDFSTAMGYYTTASGDYSTAMGGGPTASGFVSIAMGLNTEASGRYSTAMGLGTKAGSYTSTAIGRYNVGGGTTGAWVYTDPLFEIGNGTDDANKANAVTVLKNGNVGFGTATPERILHLVGANPRIFIEASSSNPEINFKNSGDPPTSIWSIYKNGSTGDLQFYQNGNKLTIQKNTGNVGIGTTNPAGKLDVNGSIYQRGGVLYSDYVFEDDYKLETIEEHAEFMWENKHLPAIPKTTVDENGVEIVEIGSHRKGIVEELEKAHIYISQLEESIKQQNTIIEEFKSRIENLELRSMR